MSNNYKNILNQLIEANNESKLVLFVGSGVSRNSNIPGWGELIEKMGNELNIPTNELTKEDYFKIPQLLFNTNEDKYNEIIKTIADNNVESNQIDDLIVKLKPDHIITTNYDNLLEASMKKILTGRHYNVIYNDASFIKNASSGNHFLIKMHGDINHSDSIVLKEQDYLDYENQHILLSNFIKSLLATHTFLFIGYSLSDNNLRLIMNWFNYLKKQLNINDDKKNVLLIDLSYDKYGYTMEKNYFNENNIDLIDLSNVKDLLSRYGDQCIIRGENRKYAKPIYSVLRYIHENDNLETCLKTLNNLKYISYVYLINIIFPLISNNKSSLNIMIKDDVIELPKYLYKRLLHYLNQEDSIGNSFNNFINKFPRICFFYKNNSNMIGKTFINNIDDHIYNRLLNNNYELLFNELSKDGISEYDRAYIKYLFMKNRQSKDVLCSLKNIEVNRKNNYVNYFINKYNISVLQNKKYNINENTREQRYSSYIKNSIERTKNDKLISKLVEEQSKSYKNYEGSIYLNFKVGLNLDKDYYNLNYLKTIVYDVYRFSIINRVFNNKNDKLYEFFLEIILITYIHDKTINNYSHDYVLNLLDVNIIVKNLDYDILENYLYKYKITYIRFLDINVLYNSFISLCDSYMFFLQNGNINFCQKLVNYVNNYLLLLSYDRELESDKLTIIYKKITYMIEKSNHYKGMLQRKLSLCFFNSFVSNHVILNKHSFNKSDRYLIFRILDINFFSVLNSNVYIKDTINYMFINVLLKNINKKDIEIDIDEICKKTDLDTISHYTYVFHKIISKEQFNMYVSKKVITYYHDKNVYVLWNLYVDGYIRDDNIDLMIDKTIDVIKKDDFRGQSYPDYRSARLIFLMRMVSSGYGLPKIQRRIKDFKSKSPILKFLYDMNDFDYSKVDLHDKIWKDPIMYDLVQDNKVFFKHLRDHKEFIYNDNLKEANDGGTLGSDEEYILIKIGIDPYKDYLIRHNLN